MFYHRGPALDHRRSRTRIRAYSTGRIHGYIAFVLVTLVVALLLFARG